MYIPYNNIPPFIEYLYLGRHILSQWFWTFLVGGTIRKKQGKHHEKSFNLKITSKSHFSIVLAAHLEEAYVHHTSVPQHIGWETLS